jgi:intracellular multiplication protein IcmQ
MKGNWDGSLLYQAIGKKLRGFSEELKKELNIEPNDSIPVTPTEMMDIIKQKSGLVEIYISVYCTEGRNLKKWELVLSNLLRQIVSRPIYKREKDIRDVIQSKENPFNDAYLVAYITEMDILKPSFRDKALLDRFGHELIRLKEASLKPENLTKLVHQTGEYSYRKGILTKL